MARPTEVLKTLKYDGKDSWKAFKLKFERYMQLYNWTPLESRDNLCFCLQGKASEYFTLLIEREGHMQYLDIMQRLEKRFGFTEIPETAQIKLLSLVQKADETIEEWADRVLQLASRAFQNLPEEFMISQAISRICHGCMDRDAGQHVVNLNLTRVEEVIDKIKSYQFNHAAIYATKASPKPQVREVALTNLESDSESESETEVVQVQRARTQERFAAPKSKALPQRADMSKSGFRPREDSVVSSMSKRLSSLESEIDELKSEIRRGFRNLGTRAEGPSRSPSRSPTRQECFECGGKGHWKNECPSRKSENKGSARKVHFESDPDSLNSKGSGTKA